MTLNGLSSVEEFKRELLSSPKIRPSSLIHILNEAQKKGYVIPQKLLGVASLLGNPESYSLKTLEILAYVSANISISLVNDLSVYFPFFARPCPSRPRHGYIESRNIESLEELYTLLLEVLNDDPNGGVMIMKSMTSESEFNFIWTPTSLAVGKGHDGATGGKDVLTIPLVRSKNGSPMKSILENSKIGPEEDPYIEAINNHDYGTQMTQLRAGPRVDSVGDFIPFEVEVKKVITPKGTLLEWEREIKSLKEGTVVYHPKGSPIDHWAVHCRASNVPIVFSREPKSGETLTQLAAEKLDPKKVLEGIALIEEIEPNILKNNCKDLANFMILNFHQGVNFSGDNSVYFGLSSALMLVLGYAASMGEARHNNSIKFYSSKPYREVVWNDIFSLSLPEIISNITNLTNIHRFGEYDSAGFGGEKWARCTISIGHLANKMIDLSKDPSEENLNRLIKSFNICMNQAHNGGWWMNKFTPKESFIWGQENKYYFTLQCAPWYGRFRDLYRTNKKSLNKTLSLLKAQPYVNFSLPRVSNGKIKLDMLYGVARIEMNFKDIERSGSHKATFRLPLKCHNLKLPLHLTTTEDQASYLVVDDNNRQIWRSPLIKPTIKKGSSTNDPSADELGNA